MVLFTVAAFGAMSDGGVNLLEDGDDSDVVNDSEEDDDESKSNLVKTNGRRKDADKKTVTTIRDVKKRGTIVENNVDEKGRPRRNATKISVDLTKIINCTACHSQINVNKTGSVHRHPVLKVLICKVGIRPAQLIHNLNI